MSRSQPAAAWGAALVRRATRANLPTPDPAELTATSPEELGERLLSVVTAAEQRGWDVEDALREAVRRYAGELDAAAHAAAPEPVPQTRSAVAFGTESPAARREARTAGRSGLVRLPPCPASTP